MKKIISMILVGAILFSVSGCASMNQTGKGSLIGAGAGVTLLIIAIVACIMIFGGEKEIKEVETTKKVETTVEPTTVEETTKDPYAGKVQSPLTGKYISKKQAKRRPVALMYNNIINAIPHSGISNADVIYEVPVEGAITRLMGIFDNYDKLKKMGSVRSCRIYYCFGLYFAF